MQSSYVATARLRPTCNAHSWRQASAGLSLRGRITSPVGRACLCQTTIVIVPDNDCDRANLFIVPCRHGDSARAWPRVNSAPRQATLQRPARTKMDAPAIDVPRLAHAAEQLSDSLRCPLW